MKDIKETERKKELKVVHIIRIDQEHLHDHIDKVVRGTVTQTLNALLDAEADQLCGAGRYQREFRGHDTEF